MQLLKNIIFNQNIINCIQKLFSPDGRFNRSQFLVYNLLNLVISIMIGAPLIYLANVTDNIASSIIIAIGLVIWIIGTVYSNYAIISKRLHDLGYNELHTIWIYMLTTASVALYKYVPIFSNLISLVFIIVILYLIYFPGNEFNNKYGPKK